MAKSGNIFVRNQGLNPAVNFNFMLRVEGLIDVPCRSVHAFQRENEYELIQEGGLNDYVHMRRKPISKPFTFQVERYVGVDAIDPLANGTELILPVILYINRNTVYGKEMDEIGEFAPVRMYVFTGCTVMAKEYGTLDAEKSGLLTETTTIAYREMVCLENIITTSQDAGDLWEFGADKKEFEGNGKRSARQNPGGEKRKSELVAEHVQHKWMFRRGNTAQTYISNGLVKTRTLADKSVEVDSSDPDFLGVQRSAVYPEGETRKDVIAQRGRSWSFKGNDYNGEGTRSAVHPEGETRKAFLEREAERNLWKFDREPGNINGLGRQSAVHPDGELRKRKLEKTGQKWPDKRSAVDINEYLSDLEAIPSRKWEFDGTGYAGGGERSANAIPNELRKSEMSQNGSRWPDKRSAEDINEYLSDIKAIPVRGWKFDKEGFSYQGSGKRSAELPKGELRKSVMEKQGVRWPDTKSAVDVATFLASRK